MVTRQECRSRQWRGISSPLTFSVLLTVRLVTAGPRLGHLEGAACWWMLSLTAASLSGQGNLPPRATAVQSPPSRHGAMPGSVRGLSTMPR